jgi:hypothetical protein
MIYTNLQAIVAGVTYDLDNSAEFLNEAYEGFGMPPVQRLISRAPQQHGDSDEGFLLEPRMLSLREAIMTSSYSALFTSRKKLLEIFKPSNNPIQLRFTLPDGAMRQIDCYFHSELGLSSRDQLGPKQRAVVRLRAPDPTFYNPTLKEEVWSVSGVGSFLVFPITFPILFTSSIINEGRVVAYAGTWFTYPIIRLTGPLQNPRVTNVTLNKKVELLFTISAGKYVDIDLSPDKKTVVDSDGINRIGTVTADSDLALWRIEADPEVAGGNNTIKVEAGGAVGGQSSVSVKYYERFIGL